MKVLLGILFFIVLSSLTAQDKILYVGAKVHVGNGKVIEQGLVGIDQGEIVLVENALVTNYNESEWDTIIKCKNHHLYPGFFAPNSTLGLTEIDAVRSTRDFAEVGEFNPHIRSEIAFNVESRVIATVRSNGVLFTQASPRGGKISGASSVMHNYGWNWEDAVVKRNDGIHLNWPKTLQGGGWWAEPKPKTANKKYSEQLNEIKSFIREAEAYNKKAKKPQFDQRYEAMNTIFNGDGRMYFHADEMKQLLDIIEFVLEFKIKNPVIVGGYDAYMIGDQLKDANIPVMLTRLHSLPQNEDDPVDLVYRLPALLKEAGVNFCLQNSGDMEAMNARNLPFIAGSAMAYGLSEEDAVRAVTLSAAEILGVDEKYGSIEKGKKATLFLSKGNALDMKTNNVVSILINGVFAPTENHQTELYLKYKKKYEKE
jgi:imidazolonepropionase-like amidohydrolase